MNDQEVTDAFSKHGNGAFGKATICFNCTREWQLHAGRFCSANSGSTLTFMPASGQGCGMPGVSMSAGALYPAAPVPQLVTMTDKEVMASHIVHGNNAFGLYIKCARCGATWDLHKGVQCVNSAPTTFTPVVGYVAVATISGVPMYRLSGSGYTTTQVPASTTLTDKDVYDAWAAGNSSAFIGKACTRCGKMWSSHDGVNCRVGNLTFMPGTYTFIQRAPVAAKPTSTYKQLAAEFCTPIDPLNCACGCARIRCDYHRLEAS